MNFTARMVRELKGAPLSCLILIAIAGPVDNAWLCRMSGYTDKPVSQALKLLSSPEYQLINRGRGGWRLTAQPQMILDNSPAPESRNNSDSTTTLKLIKLNKDNESIVVASRKNSDSLYQANLEACKAAGIFDSVAEQIAELEHVTPEFVSAHKSDLKKGETIGLAIVRIRNNELPSSWLQQHDEEISSNRYTGGAYADMLDETEDA